jgi:general secretion pathway protein I
MRARRSDGFTLLEILVAISILATALIGLLSLHGRNIQVAAYDQRLARATFLAQQVLTRVLIESGFPDPGEESGSFEEDPGFGWHVRVDRGPAGDLEEELREIQVRVFWDPTGADAATLITHVRKPDP